MDIYKYSRGKEIPHGGAVIALGIFDGVHIGHRSLLRRAKALADRLGMPFSVFTFPSENNRFKNTSPIYSTEDKLRLIESLGADSVVIADISEVANMSAEEFIYDSLIRDMRCRGAVAGYDFRFGKDRGGDAELLNRLLTSAGALCEIEDEVSYAGEKVSSTRIRNLLLAGDAEEAARLLGTPYFVTSTVKHGRGVGRELGFPTVNADFSALVPPLKNGVYRCVSVVDGVRYNSVTNVGVCPTFDLTESHIETHLIDFSGDLYGKNIRTFFLGYLRDEVRFKSEKELIMQIKVDKNNTIKKNGELKWQEIGLSLR